MADLVSPAALDWSLAHIERFGDTDLFPALFEFEVIKAYWTPLRVELAACDLEIHELSPPLKVMVPKAGSGYRAITQLDPIDALLMTGAMFEAAPKIEKFRRPRDQKTDCAYRVEIGADGQLFAADTGWKDFHEKTAMLVSSGAYGFVVCADIADYYNQASHHRIQNALSSAGVENGRTKNIEQFLSRLNSLHHSKGIPVGPAAGILLGEVCLADVDLALARKKHLHVRYVDDFRIFCVDRAAAERALHDLAEYLFTAHRLSLHPSKSRILDVESFIRDELLDPEQVETNAKRDRLSLLMKDLKKGDYEGDEIDDEEIDLKAVDYDSLRDLFQRSIAGGNLSTGLARYALRKGLKLKTRVLMDDVLKSLPVLFPVFRDVVRYLVRVSDPKDPERVGAALIGVLKDPRSSFLPFIQIWTIDAFCKKPELCDGSTALGLAESSSPLVRDRLCALVARSYGIADWVRERKENWLNHGPWAHRAILWAADVLPLDERKHWAKSAYGHPSQLTRAVAKIVGGST